MTTAQKTGITAIIMARAPIKFVSVSSHFFKFSGRTMSQMSTSLANLLIILPEGVVSKNDRGLFMTL